MCQSIWGLVQEFLHYEDFFSSSPHNVSSTSWPTRQQRAYLVFLNVGILLLKFQVFELLRGHEPTVSNGIRIQ